MTNMIELMEQAIEHKERTKLPEIKWRPITNKEYLGMLLDPDNRLSTVEYKASTSVWFFDKGGMYPASFLTKQEIDTIVEDYIEDMSMNVGSSKDQYDFDTYTRYDGVEVETVTGIPADEYNPFCVKGTL